MPGCSSPEVPQWVDYEDYRARFLLPKEGRGNGFTSKSSGLTFINSLSDSAFLANRHRVNGSGVAVGDINQDGWPDILLAGLEGPSALYRNAGGWQFEDVTEQAGLSGINPFATGVALSDVNGDGFADVLVTSLGGGIQLFLNDGHGRFADASDASGLRNQGGATTMALADVDGDRDLDLYVGFYKTATVKDLYAPSEIDFDRVVRQQADSFFVDESMAMHYRLIRQGNRLMRVELAEPDELYLNDGTGVFAPVDWTQGTFLDENGDTLTHAPMDWALTARFQDLNGDGWPDLYVCNDFESPDHIWLGDGRGQFRAMPAADLRQTSQSTMSVAVADVDADGHMDIFLADMLSRSYQRRQRQHQVIPPEVTELGDIDTRVQVMQNMLLMGRGDGSFAEIARYADVAATEWTWSSAFVDVDLDGYQDLLLTTGHAYDAMDADAQIQAQRSRRHWREQLLDFPDLDLPNMALRNRGDGTFVLQPDGWGLGLTADVAHGLATGDLDLDGDLDVVISRLNGPAGLFRNNADAPRVAVRLSGFEGNAYGIGAVIRLVAPNSPVQQQELVAGGNYLSSSEPLAAFAWSEGAHIEVHWRSGRVSLVDDVQPDFLYEIPESKAGHAAPDKPAPDQMFVAIPLELDHTEQPFDDFARQPLLPRRLSQRGPALAVADLDGNGYQDLLLGSGKGGRLQFALNFGGQFGRSQEIGSPTSGDHAGVLVRPSMEGVGQTVLAAISNNERMPQSAADSAWIEVLDARSAQRLQRIPFGLEAPGPMVLADFTGEGELDLFVGGHFRPGQYPVAVSSRIYRGLSGRLLPDSVLSAPFDGIGLISGASSSDLNQDGLADLILADGLGPIRVFINRGEGQLAEMTRALGLGDYAGWWNGVATGDFDADGLLDIIATNGGLNMLYDMPARLYYGDITNNGRVEIVEALHNPGLGGFGLVRDLPTMLNAIPPLAQNVQSYHHFASMTVKDLFGNALENMAVKDLTTSAIMIFLNRGTTFEAVPLSVSAQMSTAYGVVVADFNGDGFEDVFLAQNDFALPPSTPRMDSGLGLLLLGSETGALEPVSPRISGIRVRGPQRAAAAGDFDRDGRVDLAAAQNAGQVQLYRNATGTAGLTVQLIGPPGNPSAVGASVRLEYADGTYGPVRYVSLGDGYWSQSSLEPILGVKGEVSHVWIRWPGGAESRVQIEEMARQQRITYPP